MNRIDFENALVYLTFSSIIRCTVKSYRLILSVPWILSNIDPNGREVAAAELIANFIKIEYRLISWKAAQ